MPDWVDDVSESTVEALREQYMPEMPPLDRGAYLIAFLFEVGPVMSGGMGSAPITFGEIDAWCNRTGVALTARESRLLRQLSIAYANESHAATARDHPAPWLAPDMKPEPTAAQLAIRALANL